jgi:hypothetical protein
MEGQEMAYATLWECSVGQPKYRVKVYYDGQGVCFLCDGWSKFFIDYGVHEGWFLLFTRRDGKKTFTVCIFDGTLSARTFDGTLSARTFDGTLSARTFAAWS